MKRSHRHGLLYRRIVLPILALLRMGATPERLAWSIAAGFMIGINPLLGSTTVLCLAVAFLFRLNVAASQIANHLIYPLELLLVIPFFRLGSYLFQTEEMPLSIHTLIHEARTNPIRLTRQLWIWESHALLVWLCIAVLGTPLLAISITPLMHRLLRQIRRQPIHPSPHPAE